MAPRLAHKKSRRGCKRCKARRVKCTEERPACAACERHNVQCEYPEENNDAISSIEAHQSSNTASNKSTPVKGPASPYDLKDDLEAFQSDHDRRRLVELHLMHHWTTVVAETLPATQGDNSSHIKDLFVVQAVHLAFEYPFLLNTIFAFAALHRMQPQPENDLFMPNHTKTQALSPPEMAEYAQAHRIYLNTAIQQQREVLPVLGPINADAICVNSMLISFIALKLLPEVPNLVYEPPIQWLSMAHAIALVIRASRPFLLPDSAMQKIIDHADPNFTNRNLMYNEVMIPPFQAVLDFPEPLMTEQDKGTYQTTLAYIGGINRAIEEHDLHRRVARRIMAFGSMLPQHFITLVAERRPKALVLIAYLMALVKYVDDYWFFSGMPEHEVYGIQSILPVDWQWAMGWPIQMLYTLSQPEYRNPTGFKMEPQQDLELAKGDWMEFEF